MIDPNQEFTEKALFKAAEERDKNAVNLIIDQNPNVFDKLDNFLYLTTGCPALTAENIKFILENRPDLINIKDFLPLIREVESLDTLKFLIELKPEFINEATDYNIWAASDEKITAFDYLCREDIGIWLCYKYNITGKEWHRLENIRIKSYTQNIDKMIMLIEAGAEPRIHQLDSIIQQNILKYNCINIMSKDNLKILGAVAQGLQNLADRKDLSFIDEKSMEYANILKASIDATLLRIEKVDDYRVTDEIYNQFANVVENLCHALFDRKSDVLDVQLLTDTFNLFKSDIENYYISHTDTPDILPAVDNSNEKDTLPPAGEGFDSKEDA